MRGQTKTIAILILIMCILRLGLGLIGYINPVFLINEFGADPSINIKMSYIIRVWAIRDIVLAIIVICATPKYILPLLIGCFVIDSFDILSALLNHFSTNMTLSDTLGLVSTAIVALIPETIAFLLILKKQTYSKQFKENLNESSEG